MDPDFTQGVILAPAGSGKTYALCSKAIKLAESGQDVLFVSYSRGVATSQGGCWGMLEDLCGSSVRASYGSLTLQFSKGKIKVCDLDFVPESKWDTMIFQDGIDHTEVKYSTPSTNIIKCMSHYHFMENIDSLWCSCVLTFKRDLRGKVKDVVLRDMTKLVPPPLLPNNWIEAPFKSNPYLLDNNPAYFKALESLDHYTRVKLTSTDLTECYNQINS
jgi:hypothetical protein